MPQITRCPTVTPPPNSMQNIIEAARSMEKTIEDMKKYCDLLQKKYDKAVAGLGAIVWHADGHSAEVAKAVILEIHAMDEELADVKSNDS